MLHALLFLALHAVLHGSRPLPSTPEDHDLSKEKLFLMSEVCHLDLYV